MMSMNCRGLGDAKKRRDVLHYIRSKRLDIVFLQDTHLTTQKIPYFDTLWCGKAHHSCFSARSRGTSILFNRNLPYTLITEKQSDCGNFLILVCKIYSESYLLVNVYGPNEDNPTFYKKLNDIIDQFDVEHTIIVGDFNFLMTPEVDSLNYVSENNTQAKQSFLELTDKYNLIDAWRRMHPNERKYTWLRKNPLKAGRLDMFFVSDNMVNSMIDVEIIPGYRTDHNAITLTVQLNQPKGNGIWKFNTSHLTDDDYIKAIKTCIIHTLKQYAAPVYEDIIYNDAKHYESIYLTISDSLFYETLIMMIRGETVKFSKQKAKRRRKTQDKLMTEIENAEEKFAQSGLQNDANRLDILKKELEELRRPIIDGLITRSRVSWHEKGERNTKYFLSLEKRNFSKKTIQYIEDGDNIISNNMEVLEKFSNIYETKYSLDDNVIPDPLFVSNHVTNKLNAEEQFELDANIHMSELTSALNSMKKGKTPGSNGFPIEFFRCFWLQLGPFLHRATKTTFTEGEGLPSHREGIITLIPKKGKSPHTYKGWRPITLLNADYKIVSTVITNRLKKIMTKLINPAQTAYTAGRFIGENTRLVYDIMHWTEKHKKPGIILAADFEAAFESVAWNYLRLVINELNFGPTIQNMINHLYLNTKNHSRILLNGHLGKKIFLHRGIRQGDPASGYLFNLAVSILTEQIVKSDKLNGIQIDHQNEIRISQYADDTIIFLDGNARSITGTIKELNTFGLQSGLKINIEKTSCMAIGTTTADQVGSTASINFADKLTILGIQIERDITNAIDNNIQLKMPIIKKEIAQWNRRCLTPIGRISIVKALLLSKLVHLFTALPSPSTRCIKDIERLLFNFVWGNKNDKVKRTLLVQRYGKDGLNMVQVDSFIKSMKLSWLKRLLTSSAKWTVFAEQEVPNTWHLLTYGSKKLKLLQSKTTNAFYSDILEALIQFNCSYEPSEEELITESLWFSDWTKYQTTIVKRWDYRGLRFIGDLYDTETGQIYSKQQLENVYRIRLTFLCYTALVRSLPQRVRTHVDKSHIKKPNIPYKIELVLSRRKFSKYAYNAFIEKSADKNCISNERRREKWIADIGDFSGGSLYKLSIATANTYLIYIHYRIMQRIYATNKYLFKIQVVEHSRCSFCERVTETICHLFWYCPATQIFIKEILSHIRTDYNVRININPIKWFLLSDLTDREAITVTVMKACIHKSRLKSTKPSVQITLQYLKFEITKEYIIAKELNKLSVFEQKWGAFTRLLDVNNPNVIV